MAHKFTQNVFHPTNGSFLHTSCENCGVVVGQSDKPCPHPVAPPPAPALAHCSFGYKHTPVVVGLLSWLSFSVGLYRYQCVLKNGRLKKCFRAKVFQLAQQFRGHLTSSVNGIGIEGLDIVVDVCFKDEPGLLDFQGALINQCGRKRRLDDNDEPYSCSIINEVMSRLYFYQNLVRILGNDYVHHHADNDDDANNSPLCDSEGD
eukprot:gene4187-5718_t